MTDRDTLLALAMRVEGLSNPDRTIDAEVAAALRITPGTPGTEWIKKWDGSFIANPRSHGEPGRVALQNGCWWRAFDFTASIDAALTLVPFDYDWQINNYDGVTTDYDGHLDMGRPFRACVGGNVEVDAATPALALTAAALRARAGGL